MIRHVEDLNNLELVVGEAIRAYSGPRAYNYYLYLHLNEDNIAKKCGMDIQVTEDKNITINITLIPNE